MSAAVYPRPASEPTNFHITSDFHFNAVAIIDNLEALLAKGQDNALLRFSLGNEYLKSGDGERAISHLQAAVRADPEYSAAWKALGKALSEAGIPQGAIDAYQAGIAVAEKKGDKQAAKEMRVFKRRIEQSLFKSR